MSGIRLTEEEYADLLARQRARYNRPAVPVADVECNSGNESTAADDTKKDHPRFRIHVHSKRRRLADPDGISIKAAIDGLVRGGLLADDSAKEIQDVTFSQEKSAIEETIITVELVK